MSEPATEPLLDRDTIVAIATAPGRGGIGILRLSGPDALAIASPLLSGLTTPLTHQHARFCHLVDPATGEKLDEAVVTLFERPHSYTGETVVEIAAHGSPVLLDHLLRLLMARGARLAEPGEFTERAFLSGRLDLTQAEAVRDLIDAQTLLQAQVAAQQLGGALSRRVGPLKQELIALIAVLEAGIDFAEDDTPVLDTDVIATRIVTLSESLDLLEQSFQHGRLVTEGIRLAIVGRPNAGKSSLFNRLLARERAIVTPEPGTTRDTVHETVSLDGIPVELVDTAGMRIASSEAERLGIEKSREALADAGLVLLVLDSTEPLNAEEQAMLAATEGRRRIIVLNKCDLKEDATAQQSRGITTPVVRTSALTGEGLDALRDQMRLLLVGTAGATPDGALLTNLRQHTAVAEAQQAMLSASEANTVGLPHEMLLLDLYAALRGLDTLTGATTPDDILNLIFSTFCIGK